MSCGQDEVFAQLEPLFVAYGWGDSEFKWINQTSVAGGSAVASLSTASLSFWSLLPVTEDGGRKSRPLPQHDRGVQLRKKMGLGRGSRTPPQYRTDLD